MIVQDLVSVIMPVFNRPRMIEHAVDSVLAQDHRPLEVIIVDDASTDETGRVAEDLARRNDGVVRVLHLPSNGGPGVAREAGRVVASGEFIQYLDSDDLLLPGKFRRQIAGLRANPLCDVSYGKTRWYWIGSEPRDQPLKKTGEDIAQMFPAFLHSRWWSTSTPLYRRKIADLAGPWLSLRIEEDWEYDCRIASFGVKLHNSREFVSDQRAHAGGVSRENSTDPKKLADRAVAHSLIYRHARAAGLGSEVPEMAHFARELFLLARQCGAVGLPTEAHDLFALAREASGPVRSQGLDFRLYRLVADTIGWANAGRLARQLDRLRP